MSSFDALGAPEGNPNSEMLLQDAYEGKMMPEVRRRHWGATASDDGGVVSSVVGVTGAMGKGLADAGLGLARGLTWLGTAGQYDTSQMPQNLYDLLPEEGANNLSSRIARANIGGKREILGANVGSAGEVTGHLMAILGGGAGGAAGAGVAGAKGGGAIAKGLKGLSAATKPFTLPGQAIKALGFPGQAAGARLAAIPQVAAWTRTAKILPEVLGGATGFGLYNFVTQDGDIGDRAGAMLQGAVAGGALAIVGKLANAAEAKILDKTFGVEHAAQMGKIASKMRSGQLPGGWSAFEKGYGQVLGRTASTAIEGTGFAMLDQRFWDAALSGDMEKAVSAYVESLPAALLARTGRMNAWREFRRQAPDLNDINLRLDIINTRRGGQEPQGKPDPSGGPEMPQIKGMDQHLIDYQSGAPQPMDAVSRPLFNSGWDIPQGVPLKGSVDLVFPGGGKVTLEEGTGNLSVSPEVYRMVRGSDEVARSQEVDVARAWSYHLISGSYPKEHKGSMEGMAKQQIDIDIDVDQARSLVSHAPEGSVLHKALQEIVNTDAPYGPVTLSGLELARVVSSWGDQAGTHKNSERVNSWLNTAAEEVHRWALVEKHGPDTLAGEVAQKAPRIPLPDMVKAMAGDPIMDGATPGNIIMEGVLAEEFSRDLAAVSMMRRMSGELRFGKEAWAGGPWKSEDGRLMSVGLDGEVYSKNYPEAEGEAWVSAKSEMPDVSMEPSTPEQARWRDLAEALRATVTPNPGLDLIETSVAVAINGNPGSKSIIELNKFLGSVDPDQLAQMITPANLEHVGLVLGQIGSGHLLAEDAGMALEMALSQQGPPIEPESQPQGSPEQAGKRTGEPGNPEAGAVDLTGVADAAKGLGSMAKGGVKLAKQAIDYNYESRANEIAQVVPGDKFPAEYRTVLSNRRVMRGEAHARMAPADKAVRKLGAAWRRQTVPMTGKALVGPVASGAAQKLPYDPQVARSELVADKRVKPANQLEQQFQDAHQDGALYLWGKMREAGTVRNEGGEAKPLSDRSRAVTPRLPGTDARKAYDNHVVRKAWFDTLEALNPGVKASWLEKTWQELGSSNLDTPDIGTAFEFVREMHNVPHTITVDGTTYEMREMDPHRVMSKMIEEQSAQIATHKTWGQDLDAKQRGQGRNSGDPAVIEAMDRPGVSRVVDDLMARAKGGAGDFSTMSSTKLREIAEDAVQIAQGGSPKVINPVLAVYRDLDSVPRAMMTSLAGIYDIPELITQPALYGGILRTLAALKQVFKNPAQAIAHYERMGAISSNMTSLMFEQARGLPGAITRVAGFPSAWLERLKGAVVAATADHMLSDWGTGKQTKQGHFLARERQRDDAALLSEMELSPQEQADLLSGRFSEELANKFRNELVQMATARAEHGEGPRLADSPNARAFLRFVNFMSKRMGQTIHRIKIAIDATKNYGDKSKKSLRSWGRVASMMAMQMTVSGPIAMALGIIVHQALRGEPEEIGNRLWREMGNAPFEVLKEAAAKQLVGGTIALGAGALDASTGERAIRGIAAPADITLAVLDAIKVAANVGWRSAGAELVSQLHVIPAKSDLDRSWPRLVEWSVAAVSGEELSLMGDKIGDRDLAYKFLQGPGKESGVFGIAAPRSSFKSSQSEAFRDATAEAMRQFWRGSAQPGGFKEGLKRGKAVLDKAVKESGENPKSLAGWIRSQRTTAIIGNDKLAEFYDFVGDQERVDSIVERDTLLNQFALVIGKIERGALSDWDLRMDELRKWASTGTGDWSPVMSEAIGATAREIALNKSSRGVDMTKLDEIAVIIASSNPLIAKIFKSQDGAYVQTLDPATDGAKRIRYIGKMLLERAENAAVRIHDQGRDKK